uniref:Uncharacterized protein n=1 Tax=Arundo donax TaxID=35708 RepID=A0A0A9CH93_ARUDO
MRLHVVPQIVQLFCIYVYQCNFICCYILEYFRHERHSDMFILQIKWTLIKPKT